MSAVGKKSGKILDQAKVTEKAFNTGEAKFFFTKSGIGYQASSYEVKIY